MKTFKVDAHVSKPEHERIDGLEAVLVERMVYVDYTSSCLPIFGTRKFVRLTLSTQADVFEMMWVPDHGSKKLSLKRAWGYQAGQDKRQVWIPIQWFQTDKHGSTGKLMVKSVSPDGTTGQVAQTRINVSQIIYSTKHLVLIGLILLVVLVISGVFGVLWYSGKGWSHLPKIFERMKVYLWSELILVSSFLLYVCYVGGILASPLTYPMRKPVFAPETVVMAWWGSVYGFILSFILLVILMLAGLKKRMGVYSVLFVTFVIFQSLSLLFISPV